MLRVSSSGCNLADLDLGILPVHPPPRTDQIFSAWLLWIAFENVTSAKDLCRWLDRSRIELVDSKRLNDPLIEALIDVTGAKADSVERTLPCSLRGLFGSGPGLLWPYEVLHPWRLRIDSATRHAGGQYCPDCLREGGYLRLSWTVALYTCCLVHRCLLREGCPHCGRPIQDSTRFFGTYERDPRQAILKCYACDNKLTERVEPHVPSCVAGEIQKTHHELVRNERCLSYFSVLHKLMRVLCGSSSYGKALRSLLLPTDSLELRLATLPAGTFEVLDVRSRAIVLTSAVRLLQDWPDAFVDVMRQVRIPPNALGSVRPLPGWYRAAVKLATMRTEVGRERIRQVFRESAAREGWASVLKPLVNGGPTGALAGQKRFLDRLLSTLFRDANRTAEFCGSTILASEATRPASPESIGYHVTKNSKGAFDPARQRICDKSMVAGR